MTIMSLCCEERLYGKYVFQGINQGDVSGFPLVGITD
jgi:hypothetical protein